MVGEINNEGICATCNNRHGCRSFQNSLRANRPILYCEEFDDFAPPERADTERDRGTHSGFSEIFTDGTIPERSEGLCINCDNRKTCRFHVPQGGVLHCEEYA